MNTTFNEMANCGATVIELFREAGLTSEEIEEMLVDE
jgi:hypothetical protein